MGFYDITLLFAIHLPQASQSSVIAIHFSRKACYLTMNFGKEQKTTVTEITFSQWEW